MGVVTDTTDTHPISHHMRSLTNTTSLELTLQGMDCADCVRTVETALKGLNGVTSARVILTAERGSVIYDPRVVTPQAIVEAVKRAGADLIVIGTHGKTGMDAFWSGSITPRVSDRSPVPLLLVPIRTTHGTT